MKIGMISFENRPDEPKKNRILRACRIITAHPGADLYMLSELWNVGFFAFDGYADAAETRCGETLRLMGDAARENGAYIFTGSIVERRGNKLYNTAFLLNRHGETVGSYSKTHLFGGEKAYMTAAGGYKVCDTEFGKIGFSICYDLRFPEQYRAMTDMGAEIFLNCSAWPKSRAEHWEILNRARAIENQAICLSCCSRGADNGTRYAGVSYAVAADGRIILKTAEEYAEVEINVLETKKYRAEFPVLKDKI